MSAAYLERSQNQQIFFLADSPLSEDQQALVPQDGELFTLTPVSSTFVSVGKNDKVLDKSVDNLVWQRVLLVE